MEKKQIVLYLGYSALILLALYFASGLLKIGGEGLASLGYSGDSLKEGFIEGMTDEEKQEKKNERLQKKLEEQIEQNDKMDEAIDSTREELDTVEGMPEYQDIIEYHKDILELTVRNIIKDCITNNKPLESKSASIIKNMQLLKALDMTGSGGGVGGGGVAKKAGGFF